VARTTPGLVVSDARVGLALAAEAIHGDPTSALSLVGITGTNGKTTTAWLSELCIEACGKKAGSLGTLGFRFGGELEAGSLTTPEADEISRMAARVVALGGSHLVMEVSSHALVQARVEALRFEVAAFSNLTQDHLDFHGDMQAYAAAKRRLFRELGPQRQVINVDDAFGRELASGAEALTVSRLGPADVYASHIVSSEQGLRARLHVRGRELSLSSRLTGLFNLDNVLLVLGIVEALALDVEAAVAALGRARGVPGRFERCDTQKDDVVVIVDYAHTPGALERVLGAARQLGEGKLTCVFGCGGDRDAQKRPQMGAVVGRLATHAVVTNDNPRSEEPESIAREIVAGLEHAAAGYRVELDRALAIETAVAEAEPGEVIVIAGKGHEPYQLIGEQVLSFDDREHARRALALRRQGGV